MTEEQHGVRSGKPMRKRFTEVNGLYICYTQTRRMGLTYLPISWDGLRGQYMAYMECLGYLLNCPGPSFQCR